MTTKRDAATLVAAEAFVRKVTAGFPQGPLSDDSARRVAAKVARAVRVRHPGDRVPVVP